MSSSRVADRIVEALQDMDVSVVFTLCGNHVLPIHEAMRVRGVRAIGTRSEAAAVMAADGYGRIARRTGVVVVTGGPGVGNCVTGLLTAKGNQSPVVLISGESDSRSQGLGAQQDADHIAMTAPVTKSSVRADRPERVGPALVQAFRAAAGGRPGPVHVSVPLDVQRAGAAGAYDVSAAEVQTGVAPDHFVAGVAEEVRRAQSPVVIAGAGVWQHHGEEAAASLASEIGLPVFTLDSARGIVPDSHPCGLGPADPSLSRTASHIRDADLVIVLGRDVDFRLRQGRLIDPSATAVHVDPNVRCLGIGLTGGRLCAADPAAFARQLATSLKDYRAPEGWAQRLRAERDKELGSRGEENVNDGGIHPARAARALERVGTETNAIYAMDCGEFVQWCRRTISLERPGRWLRLGPQATCGAGLPFGLGARAADPSSPVLVVAGDGGIGYHIAELETAVEYELPVVVVVGHDRAWGVEKLLQEGIYGPGAAFTSTLGCTDFAAVARGFGADGIEVQNDDDLEEATRSALAAGRPALVQFPVARVASGGTRHMIESEREASVNETESRSMDEVKR